MARVIHGGRGRSLSPARGSRGSLPGLNQSSEEPLRELSTLKVLMPVGLCVDSHGDVYVADSGNYRILRLQESGDTTVVAGGTYGHRDGSRTLANFNSPMYLALDLKGDLLVTDAHSIRRVTGEGAVTTVAGGPTSGNRDGPASYALFKNLRGIAVDHEGCIYVADSSNHSIRRVSADGTQVTTIAGTQRKGYRDGACMEAWFANPCGIAVLDDGTLVVADSGNNCIRRVDMRSRTVVTLAGCGVVGYVDGQGFQARFNHPQGITLDGSGTIFVSDLDNHRIRRLSLTGEVTTVVESIEGSHQDDMGLRARSYQFFYPQGITINHQGHIIFTDSTNNSIRMIEMGLKPRKTFKAPKAPTLAGDLQDLLSSGMYADVTFHVKDEMFSAHKLILMARCDYFRTMFTSEMVEAHSDVVVIPDVCATAFRVFLKYVYTDKLELDNDNILGMLDISRKYLMDFVLRQCTSYIRKHLSPDNAIEWLVYADDNSFEETRHAALQYVGHHFYNIRLRNRASLDRLKQRPDLMMEVVADVLPPPNLEPNLETIKVASTR